jgi:hypothetical protein
MHRKEQHAQEGAARTGRSSTHRKEQHSQEGAALTGRSSTHRKEQHSQEGAARTGRSSTQRRISTRPRSSTQQLGLGYRFSWFCLVMVLLSFG